MTKVQWNPGDGEFLHGGGICRHKPNCQTKIASPTNITHQTSLPQRHHDKTLMTFGRDPPVPSPCNSKIAAHGGEFRGSEVKSRGCGHTESGPLRLTGEEDAGRRPVPLLELDCRENYARRLIEAIERHHSDHVSSRWSLLRLRVPCYRSVSHVASPDSLGMP